MKNLKVSTKAEINGEPSTQKNLAAPQIRQNTVRRLFATPYLAIDRKPMETE